MALLLLVSNGCLFAPEIEEEPEEILYPPEIVLESLQPPDNGILLLPQTECELDFRPGLVRDLNVKDRLYVRWFLDWDPEEIRDFWPVFSIDPSGQADRLFPEYAWDTVNVEQFGGGETHTLKLFLADRSPMAGGNGTEFQEGSEAQWDTYQWTFRVDASGVCPQ